MSTLTIVMIISFIIIAVVIALSVITTSKAYSFEHKIDKLPEEEKENKNNDKDSN